MAVPKKRTTNSAKGQRRSHHALEAVTIAVCASCNKAVQPHKVCMSCGKYRGRQVVKV